MVSRSLAIKKDWDMINTVTLMQNVKLNRADLVEVVRKLNEYAETDKYRAMAKGEHIYNMARIATGEYSITVTGYMDAGDCSDSLLLASAQAACFPVLVHVLAKLV